MMTFLRRGVARLQSRRAEPGDTGSAIVITILMVSVMTGLAVSVFVLSTNNLGNAKRDRQATSALANSEAGISQAVAYVRANGLGKIACAPNCGAANPWGQKPGAGFPSMTVTVGASESYTVWFETIVPMGAKTTGVYRVHSVGNAGSGPGSRTVEVDLQVTPFKYPLAVYADSVQAGGTGTIQTESLISKGCIFKRSQINFSGVDPVYGIPAAAHSAQYITDSQANGSSCSATDSKNIHRSGVCNATYPYDQDLQGGDLSGASGVGCYKKYNGVYPTTSLISSEADLAKQFDFDLAGLSSAQLDSLKAAASEQGFYFTGTNLIPAVLQNAATAINYPNPVLFYDLQGGAVGKVVDMNDLNAAVYGRPSPLSSTDAACHSRNVIIVVKNGDLKLNSNSILVASVFAMGPSPYGNIQKANGTSTLIGTAYARSIDLTGTADVKLDDCFLANLPGSLLSVQMSNFREVDR